MAGKRSTNLRRGDLAEGIGIEMLRSFAAVAPVPRTEDIGIDVICTLLRPDGAMQYAEDSFYVQIKSASVSKIDYQGEAYRWLWELSLPIFIARVDIPATQIEIFSMHRVFTTSSSSRNGVVLFLGENSEGFDKDIPTVSLGEPILKWKISETLGKDFHLDKYQVVKSWMEQERKNLLLRRTGRCNKLHWVTNKAPRVVGLEFGSSDNKLTQVLEEMYPSLVQLIDIFLKEEVSGNQEFSEYLMSAAALCRLAKKHQSKKDIFSVPDVLMICMSHLLDISAKQGVTDDGERKKRLINSLRNAGISVE